MNPKALFLIFTAYFDESDTHGPEPNVIVAGFLANARQWVLFARRIRNLQQKYGFKIFHAKDFKSGAGEFRGWGEEKSRRLIGELAIAIRDGLSEGVTVVLPRALYKSAYRSPPIPKGMNLDSQYGLCFRVCLLRLVNLLTSEKKKHKLHIVIESGHRNVGDTVRIFDETKAEFERMGVAILGTITVAKKSECPLLMVADFQAHTSSISEARLKLGMPGYFEMAAGREGDPKRGEAALTQMEFTAESLHQMKAAWGAEKQARVDKWRVERTARRASLAVSPQGQPS